MVSCAPLLLCTTLRILGPSAVLLGPLHSWTTRRMARSGRTVISSPKIPSPAPNQGKKSIFANNRQPELPQSTVPKVAEATPRVVLTRALFLQGGYRCGAVHSMSPPQCVAELVLDNRTPRDKPLVTPDCFGAGLLYIWRSDLQGVILFHVWTSSSIDLWTTQTQYDKRRVLPPGPTCSETEKVLSSFLASRILGTLAPLCPPPPTTTPPPEGTLGYGA